MSTKKIALSGILLALSVATLFLASVVPGMELTLYALSSFYIAIMMIEAKGTGGFTLYLATLLLTFLVVPNKMALLPYAGFFGLYGIAKFYIEKINTPALQLLGKLSVFFIIFCGAYFFMRQLFFANITLPDLPLWLLLLLGGAMFLLYDTIYTLVIALYLRRIHKQKS